MKKYVLTSKNLVGSVVFGYDANGMLQFYDATPAEMSLPQVVAVLKNLPKEEHDLQELANKTKCTLELLPEDLSFDVFWNKYDKKINRKRAEPLYKKLNDADKMRAILNVKPYDNYLSRTGIGKAHPENYLNKEYFNVDWNKEK